MQTIYYYWPTPPYLAGRNATFDSDALTSHVTGGGVDDLTSDYLARAKGAETDADKVAAKAQAMYTAAESDFKSHFPTFDPSNSANAEQFETWMHRNDPKPEPTP